MTQPKIIDADKVTGPVNIDYDWDLIYREVAMRHGLYSDYFPLEYNSLETEKLTEEAFRKALQEIQ